METQEVTKIMGGFITKIYTKTYGTNDVNVKKEVWIVGIRVYCRSIARPVNVSDTLQKILGGRA